MPFVDIGDAEIFYTEVGVGDPLVLVHGGFLDHNLWAFVAPTFAEEHRVIALDLLAHGQSTGKVDLTMAADAAADVVVGALASFVERLAVAPAHFAGQSAGGAFILELASRRPELVRTMSLHEPTVVALLDDEFAVDRERGRAALRLLADDLDAGLAAFVACVGGDWDAMPEPGKALFRGNAHIYAGARFFQDPANAVPLPSNLDTIEIPTLFTKGPRSPRYFHVSADRVAAAMPNATVKTIDGAGHAAMLEQPDVYARIVQAFIRGASPR